jgi:1-acyl-sn-glycerol-3-phosphate acyltransferase
MFRPGANTQFYFKIYFRTILMLRSLLVSVNVKIMSQVVRVLNVSLVIMISNHHMPLDVLLVIVTSEELSTVT